MSVVVKLDNPRNAAGPATVIAVVESLAEYYAIARDRDGAINPSYRLWGGTADIGDRVVLSEELR